LIKSVNVSIPEVLPDTSSQNCSKVSKVEEVGIYKVPIQII